MHRESKFKEIFHYKAKMVDLDKGRRAYRPSCWRRVLFWRERRLKIYLGESLRNDVSCIRQFKQCHEVNA